jgi:hypothetical protein
MASKTKSQAKVTASRTAARKPAAHKVRKGSRDSRQFTVSGTVRDASGALVDGAIVIAYDRDMRSEQRLGRTRTRAGHFSIAYSSKSFARAEKGTADLRVAVIDARRHELASSGIRFNATAEEVVHLQIDAPPVVADTSEYERLIALLAPLLEDVPLARLTQDDIDFLAADTAEDRQRIEWLSVAARLALESSPPRRASRTAKTSGAGAAACIPPEVFYAWLRQDQPTELPALWAIATERLIQLVDNAAQRSIVPRALADQLDPLARIIESIKVDRLLQPAPERAPASLGDLLGTMPTPLGATKQRVVAETLRDAKVSDDELEQRLQKAKFTAREIASVRATRALGELASGHTALVQELQELRPENTDHSLQFLTQVAPVRWLELAYKHEATNPQPRSPEVYAEQLQRAVEVQHPMAVLAARIRSGDLELRDPGLKAAADVLAANPQIELNGRNARTLVAALGKTIADPEALVGDLQKLTRARNLADNWRETGALLRSRLDDSLKIASYGVSEVRELLADSMSRERADAIHAEAKRVHDTTIALATNTLIGLQASVLGFIQFDGSVAQPAAEDGYASLRQLFGNLTTCDCEQCQSVLSPAAYLVDLLRFLDRQNDTARTYSPPLWTLFARRPDIADLELTCKNTNTEIPYIDLVLEVLENAIALPIAIPAPYGFDPAADLARTPVPQAALAALRTVLARSAISVGESLQIERSSRQLLIGTFTDWLITDGARHWTLRHFPQSLTGWRLGWLPVTLQVPDYAAAAVALDQGSLPNNDWVIPAGGARDATLPLAGTPTVTVIEAGKRWQVSYTRAVRVSFIMAAPMSVMILKSVTGQQLAAEQNLTQLIQRVAFALMQGTVVDPLLSLLPEGLPYRITRIGTEWEISTQGTFLVVYSPDQLQVASLTYQTSDAREDLLATPENRNPAAYDLLDGAVFPWTLPFNLWLTEVRAFLERRGISRRRLMEDCNPSGRLTTASTAREVLGLSLAESALIAGTSTRSQWECWGLQQNGNRLVDRNDERIVVTGAWTTVLGANVSILMQQSGLSYRELLNVLQTRFVRAQLPALTPQGADCNPSKMRLIGLAPGHLDRIHRLVRLWRKRGGSLFDLDLAIAADAQAPTALDDAALLRLSNLQRLRELLGLPTADIAAWWGAWTTGYTDHTSTRRPSVKSLYERLFLNPTLGNPPDRAFLLNAQGTEILGAAAPAAALASKTTLVAAALGITQTDLDALIADLIARQALDNPPTLKLANLTLLFRNVSLARALALSMPTYLRLRSLVTTDPFASAANAVSFVEEARFIAASGFTVEALQYLLRYTTDAAPNDLLPEAWASAALTDVRNALQSVQRTLRDSADAVPARVRSILTGIGWYDELVESVVELFTAGDALAVQIPGAPAVMIPPALATRVSYRPSDGRLAAAPDLTAAQWNSFDNANAAGSVKTAIGALRTKATDFAAALPERARLLQSIELPVFSTAYAPQSPPAMQRELAARCYFDAVAQRLTFRGWMTTAQQTQLATVVPAAIAAALKAQSDQYTEVAGLNAFFTNAADVSAQFAIGQTPETRAQEIVRRVLPYLYRRALADRLGAALEVEPALVADLLAKRLARATTLDALLASAFVDSDARVTITPRAFAAQFRAICKVHKAAFIYRTVKLALTETSWLPPAAGTARVFDALNVDTLPSSAGDAAAAYPSWRQSVELFQLRDRSHIGSGLLDRLLRSINIDPAALIATQNDVAAQHAFLAARTDSAIDDVTLAAETLNLQWPADYQSTARVGALLDLLSRLRIARALQVSADDVASARSHLGHTWPADLQNPSHLTQLFQLLITLQRLGANAADSFTLTEDAAATALVPAKPGNAEALLARKLLRARYDADSWPQQLKPIVDAIRHRQRDALVGYLIAHPPQNAVNKGLWKDANDVYEHYLIDPQMSACRVSTRILHAISAVQLFIQRCAMNLEKDVTPAAIDAERLKWMSNYRVWEANRKVFLYPENWIEPELREHKSEVFQDLEGQLQQSEFDAAAAQEILKRYLKQLEDISRLAIVGMYIDQVSFDGRPELRIHIVGRTRNRPARFYYRCWTVSQLVNRWEPWEHVALVGVKSDHVLPFVLRGDIYIAWPEMTQLGSESTVTDQGSTSPGAKWRVQMGWIRRTTRGWSDRLMSSDVLEHAWVYGKDENQTFTFRVRNADVGYADIDCYGAKREGSLIYSENAPSLTASAYRSTFPVLRSSPWIRVHVTGTVYASYSNGAVYRKLSNAPVRCYLKYNGAAQDREAAAHDREADRQTGLDGTSYGSMDDVTTQTDSNGNFSIELYFFALQSDGGWFSSDVGFFRASVMRTDPTFELEVSYGNQAAQTQSFPYKDPAKTAAVQYYSSENFQRNFVIPLQGAAPGGETDRPVTIVPAGKFRIYTAEDAQLLPLTAPLAIPTGALTYGSGFKIVGAAPTSPLQAQASGGTAVTIWNGVATTYSLLQAAPFGAPAADIYVYRDADKSYWIRRQSAPIDAQNAQNLWQVLDDGHPRASELRREISISGVAALFDLPQQSWQGATPVAMTSVVDTTSSLTAPGMRFEPDETRSPHASYNAELFFHVPLLIASFLTRNQRHAEAQQWLRLILDPTTAEAGTGNQRYWRYLPFRKHSETQPIDELLRLLADPGVPASNSDKQQITTQIDVWSKNPFRPHTVAQLRPRGYQFATVFKWLDNAFAWGDSLFRQYTTESINEATQLYMLIAKFLGPRPQSIPRARQPAPLTYRRANNQWDAFANVWREIESNLVIGSGSVASGAGHKGHATSVLTSIGLTYFCVPRNEKLLEYWDRLDQRLFSIRHCRNIDGVQQELPLFAPPIDPALLVRATAAGLDIATVIAQTNAPLPYYRFSLLLQKALELCSELKSLSGALLSVLEKKDAEQLALLRSGHENALLKLVQDVREAQIAEAQANIAALRQSEKIATTRFTQYQRLLGNDRAEVPEEAGADIEQATTVSVAANASGDVSNLGLTKAEQDQIGWSDTALNYAIVAGAFNMAAGVLFAFPDISAGTPFFSSKFGGTNLGYVANSAAALFNLLESNASRQASRAATIGQHQRRQDEWVFQSRLALQDIQQIRKQIIAAQVRLDIATKELANHQRQIANAEETDRFMREKYTNRELYQWMTQQLSGLCFGAYQLAFEAAKRAECAFREELGVQGTSYIRFGYWDTMKKGLLAGDQLAYDLRRLDAAYLEQNRREYEITKHISLLSLDPTALIALRETGTCEVEIPEALFDLDYPGHYLRRIKSIALTIPCVTGPYASVSCSLELLKSSVRHDNAVGDTYQPDGNDDARFRRIFGRVQTIVTSNAQQDSGLFDTNLRDERRLPCEGSGVISTWRLSLPAQFRQFDYATIADVILHMRYTARDGGGLLRDACVAELRDALNAIKRASSQTGLARLFSLKQEFPTQWYRLTHAGGAAGARSELIALAKQRFPFLFSGADIGLTIERIDLCIVPTAGTTAQDATEFPTVFLPKKSAAAAEEQATSAPSNPIGNLPAQKLTTRYADGSAVAIADAEERAQWRVEVAAADVAGFRQRVADIFFVCHYGVR